MRTRKATRNKAGSKHSHRTASVDIPIESKHASSKNSPSKHDFQHARSAQRRAQKRTAHERYETGTANPPQNLGSVAEDTSGDAKGTLLTRRNLIFGGAGAAILAAGIGAYALNRTTENTKSSNPSTSVGSMSVLNVPADAVFTTEDCTFIENQADVIMLTTTCTLPFGTLIWADDDDIAACLLPTQTSSPLAKVGLIPLSSGRLITVLEQAKGHEEGFEIYDVRANAEGIVWLESNIMSGEWRIYTSKLDGVDIVEAALSYESDASWNMPSLVVSGNHAYWQTSSVSTESTKLSKGLVMRARFGSGEDEVEEVYDSKTAFSCSPTATPAGIIIAPRLNVSGTYYQLTVLDSETNDVIDKLILPSTIKPSEIAYGPCGFSFCLEGIYNNSSGIANLGTYACATPIPKYYAEALEEATEAMKIPEKEGDEPKELTEEDIETAQANAEQTIADLYSTAEWFRFPRSPLTDPAWCGDYFLVKSTNVVAGIDFENRTYFIIEPENATQSYGEFLASTSTSSRFVTYANLDYTPMNGSHVRECKMRVWELAE